VREPRARHCYEEKRKKRKERLVSSGALCMVLPCLRFISNAKLEHENIRDWVPAFFLDSSADLRGIRADANLNRSMHHHVIEGIAGPREQATEGKPGTLRRCIMCGESATPNSYSYPELYAATRGCEWARRLEITTRKMLVCAAPSPSLPYYSLSLSLLAASGSFVSDLGPRPSLDRRARHLRLSSPARLETWRSFAESEAQARIVSALLQNKRALGNEMNAVSERKGDIVCSPMLSLSGNREESYAALRSYSSRITECRLTYADYRDEIKREDLKGCVLETDAEAPPGDSIRLHSCRITFARLVPWFDKYRIYLTFQAAAHTSHLAF